MSKSGLYRLVGITCVVVYGWVGYNMWLLANRGVPASEVCLLKSATGIPCPFCGTTRSVMCVAKAEFLEAVLLNPLGLLVAGMVVIAPVWIFIDYLRGKESFYVLFNACVKRLQYRGILLMIAMVLVMLWFYQLLRL